MKKKKDIYRNSKLHYFISRMLERIEMEGFTISYSQSGEDLVLKNVFGKNKREGFYVDIGCNYPIQKNNTFKLYLKGWTGINVDGNADLIKNFKRIRTRDICLAEIMSNDNKEMVFYQDEHNPGLSSVDSELAGKLKSEQHNIKEVRRRAKTLENILDEYGKGRKIDLLCMDVENHDLEVLQGNNFDKYRPTVICIECFDDMDKIMENEVSEFLVSKGYELWGVSTPNIFFKDKSQQVHKPRL